MNIFVGDLVSQVTNPWSKYLLASKYEEQLDKEFQGRYKGSHVGTHVCILAACKEHEGVSYFLDNNFSSCSFLFNIFI